MIHLLAIAGRIGVELKLEDFDKLGSEVNNILNLQPSGKYLMEDFCYAGGLPAVMREILPMLHGDALVVAMPEVKDRLTAMGLTVGFMTQQQLAAREQAYTQVWTRIVKEKGFAQP
mgnify:CR=1 FL=1